MGGVARVETGVEASDGDPNEVDDGNGAAELDVVVREDAQSSRWEEGVSACSCPLRTYRAGQKDLTHPDFCSQLNERLSVGQ